MRPYNRYTYTEEIGKLHGANENSPRRAEIKVRKNEMKLRKKGIKVRKNFFVPHWIIQDPSEELLDFLQLPISSIETLMDLSCINPVPVEEVFIG